MTKVMEFRPMINFMKKDLLKALICMSMFIFFTVPVSAKTVIDNAVAVTDEPNITYSVDISAERIGEKKVKIDYTINATPAKDLNSKKDTNETANVKIVATLFTGSVKTDITLKKADTSWTGGKTYSKSGSFNITTDAKTGTISTALSVKGDGVYVTVSMTEPFYII